MTEPSKSHLAEVVEKRYGLKPTRGEEMHVLIERAGQRPEERVVHAFDLPGKACPYRVFTWTETTPDGKRLGRKNPAGRPLRPAQDAHQRFSAWPAHVALRPAHRQSACLARRADAAGCARSGSIRSTTCDNRNARFSSSGMGRNRAFRSAIVTGSPLARIAAISRFEWAAVTA